jgi:DNA-binding transcriptional ArsR family regulator
MDFKRLRILRELADRGSVGATAEAMHVTPSAVSQQLRTLQDELGVVLMEKSGRGVRLTEAGQAMASAAADVSTAMARAEATIDTYRQGWQAHISAAFFPSAAEMFLPGLLHRVKAIEGILRTRELPVLPVWQRTTTLSWPTAWTARKSFPGTAWWWFRCSTNPLTLPCRPAIHWRAGHE